MHQHTHASLALLLAAAVPLLLVPRADAQTQIYPPLPAPGGNYVIAVISDGYTNAESWKFDRAVNGLILNELMADPFYKGHLDKFRIMKIFKWVGTSGQSSFQITPNYDSAKCYIDVTAHTTALIEAAVQSVAPERTVVIGNYEGMSMGCAQDTWAYVSAGAREVGGVLEHEFGHFIAGLFDEYVLTGNETVDYPGPDVDGPNCSNVFDAAGKATPHWSQATWPRMPTNPPGCRTFGAKIVRPYDDCRMRSDNKDFCYVCSDAMSTALAPFGPQKKASAARVPVVLAGFGVQPTPVPLPAPTGPSPDRAVRLIVQLTRQQAASATATTAIVAISQVTVPIVQRIRRVGDWAYGVIEGPNALDAGVLPGDPFQQRNYGGISAPHTVNDGSLVTRVTVLIPRMALSDLALGARKIGINFYKLEPAYGKLPGGAQDNVTTDTIRTFLAANRTRFAEVTPAQLQAAAAAPPAP